MKKIFCVLFSVLALSLLLSACDTSESHTHIEQVAPERMIHYKEISDFDSLPKDGKPYVIFFAKGDTIPLKVHINNDYLFASEKELDITAKRTVYFLLKERQTAAPSSEKFQMRQSEIFISFDALRWASIHDTAGFKEIAGVDDDSVAFGFEVTNTEGVVSKLIIESKK